MMKLLNIIAFPATVVLGLLLMLSGLVPSISPNVSSWLPLLGLAFPVLFLLVLLTFLYWLIQRKWRSLFSLSCLLLNLGPASLYVQWNDLKAERSEAEYREESLDVEMNMGSQRLKIISYNAQLFGLYQDETSVSIVNTEYMPAMDSFLRVMKAEKADVVCFRNARIRVYNLHLQSFRFAKQDYAVMQKQTRQQQIDIEGSKGIISRLRLGYKRRAEQVGIVKESMIACDFPKIICGDFNDIPVSYTYRQLSAGMKDAFGEAGRGLETTYKGSMPSFRIDYILYDNPMRAIRYHSVEDVPSDHKLIGTELQIGDLFRAY